MNRKSTMTLVNCHYVIGYILIVQYYSLSIFNKILTISLAIKPSTMIKTIIYYTFTSF